MKNRAYSFSQYLAEMRKHYGERISIEDFSKIEKGTDIVYRGFTYKVKSSNEYSLSVEDKYGDEKKINRAMFIEYGAIR
jgi:hypothetical protein